MYSDKHADELLVFDLSMGDKEHEEALDIIKSICENVEIPVIGAGNVKRMEDVKKLLYAGCQKAVLNYSKEGNIVITEEVSKNLVAMKEILYGTNEKEPQTEAVAQLAQELYNSGLLSTLVADLQLIDFEVRNRFSVFQKL